MRDPVGAAAVRRPAAALAAVALGLAVLAAVGAGVYGLWLAPEPAAPAGADAAPPMRAPTTAAPAPSFGAGGTGDPEGFARWAAETLFAWDAATMDPADVTATLVAAADPAGEETAGLAADIAGYLPDAQTWAKLRGMAATQRLDIDAIIVPDKWERAVADAAAGQILPGTVAYTVTGTRRREGVWEDQPAVFDQPVSFTLFVTCAPSFPECHLMRLSKLGEPL